MTAPAPVVLEGRFVRLEPLAQRHRTDLEAAVAEDPAAPIRDRLRARLYGS